MPDRSSVQGTGLVSDAALQQWLRGELHRFLHVERVMGRQQLADAARINVHTLDAIRKTGEGCRPAGVGVTLSLCCVMGERSVNGLLAHIGYSGAAALDDQPHRNVSEIVANVLPDLSTIAQAAIDGRIDHTEEPGCRAAADHIIAELLPISSLGNRE